MRDHDPIKTIDLDDEAEAEIRAVLEAPIPERAAPKKSAEPSESIWTIRKIDKGRRPKNRPVEDWMY